LNISAPAFLKSAVGDKVVEGSLEPSTGLPEESVLALLETVPTLLPSARAAALRFVPGLNSSRPADFR
jgi:hypothetical protein